MHAPGQAFPCAARTQAKRPARARISRRSKNSFYNKGISLVTVYGDGTYDVVVIDVKISQDDARNAFASIDVLITSGSRKGEVLALRMAREDDELLRLLGLPATLSIVDGVPRLRV
jgi:hypothetical protein